MKFYSGSTFNNHLNKCTIYVYGLINAIPYVFNVSIAGIQEKH